MSDFQKESMLDLFIYEMNQLLEQLEQSIIQGEQGYSNNDINEIFRVMHTIKGSAAMMMYSSIEGISHAMEDLFFYLREKNPENVDYSVLTDLILEGMDFIKGELGRIQAGEDLQEPPEETIIEIKSFLGILKGEKHPEPEKQKNSKSQEEGKAAYMALLTFVRDAEMRAAIAFSIMNNMKDYAEEITTEPADLKEEKADSYIADKGFKVEFKSEKSYEELIGLLSDNNNVENVDLNMQKLNNFVARISFEDGCEMENVRAFTVIHNLKNMAENIIHVPEDVIEESATEVIRKNGFLFKFSIGKPYGEIFDLLNQTVFLKELKLKQVNSLDEDVDFDSETDEYGEPDLEQAVVVKAEPKQETVQSESNVKKAAKTNSKEEQKTASDKDNQVHKKQAASQQMISVNIGKLDQLLNLMGELVISEAMTTQNPDLENLELENFNKSARQLRKIINDVQDTVMSLRMVSLSTTFFKMHRVVRDMSKNLGKNVDLVIVGEETEVDKNIIEHISDPLMHIIRNSVDHGIEMPDERVRAGKEEKGTVILEAKNSGGEVLIIVKDDGAGIDKDKVLKKAISADLLKKPAEDYTDREIFQFIFHPGLSTNDAVTTYSGRGVGMDVVLSNIEVVGGSIIVDSVPGEGTTTTLKIPLTLAIIEGMLINMGGAKYTIPIASILETFKAKKDRIFTDPDGNEMITIRGEIFNIVRLYDFFEAPYAIKEIEDGVFIMIEHEGQSICLFVDELVGEQQVVVKTLPKYVNKIKGISGCTLLGNGDISLIIDVAGFFDK